MTTKKVCRVRPANVEHLNQLLDRDVLISIMFRNGGDLFAHVSDLSCRPKFVPGGIDGLGNYWLGPVCIKASAAHRITWNPTFKEFTLTLL